MPGGCQWKGWPRPGAGRPRSKQQGQSVHKTAIDKERCQQTKGQICTETKKKARLEEPEYDKKFIKMRKRYLRKQTLTLLYRALERERTSESPSTIRPRSRYPILYSNLLYIMGKDFLDRQHYYKESVLYILSWATKTIVLSNAFFWTGTTGHSVWPGWWWRRSRQ